jgi:hypothetical protein
MRYQGMLNVSSLQMNVSSLQMNVSSLRYQGMLNVSSLQQFGSEAAAVFDCPSRQCEVCVDEAGRGAAWRPFIKAWPLLALNTGLLGEHSLLHHTA